MTKQEAARKLDGLHNSIKRNLELGKPIQKFSIDLNLEEAEAFVWAFQALVHWSKEEADSDIRNQRMEYMESKMSFPDNPKCS